MYQTFCTSHQEKSFQGNFATIATNRTITLIELITQLHYTKEVKLYVGDWWAFTHKEIIWFDFIIYQIKSEKKTIIPDPKTSETTYLASVVMRKPIK